MRRTITMLLAIGLLISMMSGCETNSFGKKETGAAMGAAGGAVLGQVIGGSTEATLLGGALGGVLGYVVGNQMEKSDRTQLNQALESTPSHETTRWTNPDTGKTFAVTPKPSYEKADTSQVCRDVEIFAEIEGKTEKTQAVACREDGKWVIQQ